MAYQDASASLNGQLDSSASAMEIEETEVFLQGVLRSYAKASQHQNAGFVHMDGALNSTVESVLYKDAYVSMYGFLTSTINIAAMQVICPDIFMDMYIQTIEAAGCTMNDEPIELIRYRGDTYPIRATLGRNGNFDTTGITFKMSTKIGSMATFTADGTIIDATNGIVEFPFPTGSVDVAGEGVFDIQGNDGYIYTYEKGVFILIDDVTK